MAVRARVIVILVKNFIIWSFMLSSSFGNATLSDVQCLQSIKQSLEDPLNNLSTWMFDSVTEGFICQFVGVDCWHDDQNKVLNIRLGDMGLKGKFPLGIMNCTSLVSLDLSNNDFSGPIPSDICRIVPFITSLDLSFNRFSGNIPESLPNCTYLSVLNFQKNQFVGQIPQRLGELQRIRSVNFANNFLSGRVPSFYNATIAAESYANNTALCGGPLESCKDTEGEYFKESFVAGFVIGWPISAVSVIAALRYYSMHKDKKRGKNMKLTMPMTTALMIRRENKKKERNHSNERIANC